MLFVGFAVMLCWCCVVELLPDCFVALLVTRCLCLCVSVRFCVCLVVCVFGRLCVSLVVSAFFFFVVLSCCWFVAMLLV